MLRKNKEEDNKREESYLQSTTSEALVLPYLAYIQKSVETAWCNVTQNTCKYSEAFSDLFGEKLLMTIVIVCLSPN